jgi:putative DNA primase/helicase
MIYTIAGGKGKGRMTADANLRDSSTWATFAILSCEISLADKVTGDGGDWAAGMAVRVPDIDVDGVNRQVDAKTLRAINGVESHYGHAGVAFVDALIENGVHQQPLELRDRVQSAAISLAGGVAADAATTRAATPFALLLIPGEMAKGFGLIPAEAAVEEAVQWAWKMPRSWTPRLRWSHTSANGSPSAGA